MCRPPKVRVKILILGGHYINSYLFECFFGYFRLERFNRIVMALCLNGIGNKKTFLGRTSVAFYLRKVFRIFCLSYNA